MGQNALPGRARSALISIDWMLLAVAVIVILFCLGAFIRITSEPQMLRQHGGLQTLGAEDNLLAFEDFNFGTEAWSQNATSDRLGGLGPVLGPFTNDAVSRNFQLPVDTQRLRVSFDVHLHGGWAAADAMRVMLDEDEVLMLTLADIGADQARLDVAVAEGNATAVNVEQTRFETRSAEPVLPGVEEPAIISLRVTLLTTPSSDLLTLDLAAQVGNGASWTLDNLAVVATTDGAA